MSELKRDQKSKHHGILASMGLIDRRAIPASLGSAFLLVAIPYFAIWGSKIILDSLAERNADHSQQLIIFVVLVTALLGLMRSAVNSQFSYLKLIILRKQRMKMAEKALRMRFDVLEGEEPKQLQSMLQQYDSTGAIGPISYMDTLYTAATSIFSMVIAIFLIIPFFTKRGVLPIPTWLENGSLLILIVLYAIFSLLLSTAMQKTIGFDTLLPLIGRHNAIYGFFVDSIFDPDKAKMAHLQSGPLFKEHLLMGGGSGPMSDLMKKLDGVNYKLAIYGNLLQLLLTLCVYLLIAMKTWHSVISYGETLLYTSAFFMLSQALSGLFNSIPQVLSNKDYFKRFGQYLALPEGERMTSDTKKLACEHVVFQYPESDRKVLDDVSIEIHRGEKVALVGENGSGKTTLVKLLSGLYQAESGQVDAPKSLSTVFQDYVLLNGQLKDVLACNDDSDQQKTERLNQLLSLLGMSDRIGRLKEKLNSKYGSELYESSEADFSGGEKQKLAIARALYEDHDYLIMDEPTAALDPIAEAEIYQILAEITGDRGLLLISHRLSSCIFCDKIYVLKDGKLVETGTHKDLLKLDGYYKTLWDAQAGLYQNREIADSAIQA